MYSLSIKPTVNYLFSDYNDGRIAHASSISFFKNSTDRGPII